MSKKLHKDIAKKIRAQLNQLFLLFMNKNTQWGVDRMKEKKSNADENMLQMLVLTLL